MSLTMTSGDVHTVPQDGKWANRIEDGEVFSTHGTKEEAVSVGRDRARSDEVEHLIHDRQGQIQERNSYGNDPRSRKG